MALTDRSIVTLQNVKDYLNQPDESLDTWLEWQIDLASGKVEEYTGKHIQPTAVEEILDGEGRTYLWTTYWPVTALVGATDGEKLGNLQYRDDPTEEWQDLLADLDYVRFSKRSPYEIQLLDGFTFPFGEANVRVEYIAGYDPIPADIAEVVIEMVAVAYRESKNGEGTLGVSSKNAGQAGVSGSVSYLDLTPKWKSVLDRYRSLA